MAQPRSATNHGSGGSSQVHSGLRGPTRFGSPGSEGGAGLWLRLGVPYSLLLIWLIFEFGRPSRPFGIPLLISVASLAVWVNTKDKQWARQTPWWFVLLGVAAIGVMLAENTYSAYWAARDMAVLFLCICLPLQSFTTSIGHVRVWIYTFLAVTFYVGVWAVTHGGYGPAGSDGAQDENYVAAMMGMSIALAYFSFFGEKRFTMKALLALSMVVSVGAIALGHNPSRGGFLGLCAVGLYCVSRSPRKGVGIGILGAMAIALLVIAGPAFWEEIRTSTDFQSGTGDMRLELWKAGLQMWIHNPLFGVGPGNFKWMVGEFQSAAQFEKFGRDLGGSVIAHSSHVEMLAEVGTIGALATAMLVWHTWRDLGRVRDEATRLYAADVSRDYLWIRCQADGLRAAILAILVNGVFLSLFYFSHLWLLLAVGTALPFIMRRRMAQDPGLPGPVAAPPPVRTRGGRSGVLARARRRA